MQNNTYFKLQDLLMNSNLKNVFPQFSADEPLQNVYSFAKVERQILQHLKNALNGSITGNGELLVNGKHTQVLRQVRSLQVTIEAFFNSMPSIAKNLRNNTTLYTTFASSKELEELKTPLQKAKALKQIIDNINFNPNFNSENRLPNLSQRSFERQQNDWKKRVGYKEK